MKSEIAEILRTAAFGVSNLLLDACPKCLTCEQWAKSNEYYGEELINFAFSPKSGALQLQSHPNEQNGIRNFFSGANAIFRNPSAHRFVDYDDKTAEAIIAMVAMMANLASEIKENTKPKRK